MIVRRSVVRGRLLLPLVALCVLPAAVGAQTPPPPANDAFEQAASLGESEVAGTIEGATAQPGEPLGGRPSVWYVYRPTVSQRVAVEARGPDHDWSETPNVGVFTGATLSSLRAIGRSKRVPARVAFQAAAGETYWIAMSEDEYKSTEFRLRVRPVPPPANDAFADAQRVEIPGEYKGNLADATGELGEPRDPTTPQHSVWFRFEAPRTGKLTIDAGDSDCVVAPSLYTGGSLETLKKVDVKEDGAVIRLVMKRGQRYFLRLWCSVANLGDYSVILSDGSITGKGVTMAVDPGQSTASLRASGLKLQIAARRRVWMKIELAVSKRTARRLGLKSTILGRLRGKINYDQRLPARVRLNAKTARALKGVTSLSGAAKLTLRNKAPNRVLRVPVRLPN